MTDTQQIEDASVSNKLHAEIPVAVSLGSVLAAARSEKKLSQQDVSDSLRYSVKQIDALEHDAFDLLPDAMITRGFIRNYARLLEIDATPLLDAYRQLSPVQSSNPLAVNPSMQPVQLTKDSQPWLLYILGSILVLLFLLAWFVYLEYLPEQFKLQYGENQPVTASVSDAPVNSEPAVEMPLPEVALPAAERQPEEVLPQAVDSATTNQPVVVQQAPSANQQVGLQTQQSTSASPATKVLPTESSIKSESQLRTEVNPAGVTAKKVSMTVTEETWVRVSDKSGQVLYESTLDAGDTQLLSFLPPFNVVIGNAKAATVNVSGQALDLASYTRNNVARISLE